MINFKAKRYTGRLALFAPFYTAVGKADGHFKVPFGQLLDCETSWVFESDDEELQEWVNHSIEADMNVKEMLAVVRRCYEAMQAQAAAEAAAECYAENAWMRAAEYDPEGLAHMEMEDAMGKT